MKILKSQSVHIDSNEDGVLFNFTIFNEGKYDKEHLRNITRNTGIRLEIQNAMTESISINSFGFFISKNNQLKIIYRSSKINNHLPIELNSSEQITLFLYAYQLNDILDDFENEECIFKVTATTNQRYDEYSSSYFSGDKVEEIISEYESDECSNWGNQKYISFDIKEEVQ